MRKYFKTLNFNLNSKYAYFFNAFNTLTLLKL